MHGWMHGWVDGWTVASLKKEKGVWEECLIKWEVLRKGGMSSSKCQLLSECLKDLHSRSWWYHWAYLYFCTFCSMRSSSAKSMLIGKASISPITKDHGSYFHMGRTGCSIIKLDERVRNREKSTDFDFWWFKYHCEKFKMIL